MTKRLRIAQVVVRPVLVWDDGENLTPGPSLEPKILPLVDVAEFAAGLPFEVSMLESNLLTEQAKAEAADEAYRASLLPAMDAPASD